jgi:hypothetical protein
MTNTSITYAGLKADRPGSVNIYEDQLRYEAETGDRPWRFGFYRRLEAWAQKNWGTE